MAAQQNEATSFLLNSRGIHKSRTSSTGSSGSDNDGGYEWARSSSSDELDEVGYDDIDVAAVCSEDAPVVVSKKKTIHHNPLTKLPQLPNKKTEVPTQGSHEEIVNKEQETQNETKVTESVNESPNTNDTASTTPTTPLDKDTKPRYPELEDHDGAKTEAESGTKQVSQSASQQNEHQQGYMSWLMSWIPTFSSTSTPTASIIVSENNASEKATGVANGSPTQQGGLELPVATLSLLEKEFDKVQPFLRTYIEDMVKKLAEQQQLVPASTLVPGGQIPYAGAAVPPPAPVIPNSNAGAAAAGAPPPPAPFAGALPPPAPFAGDIPPPPGQGNARKAQVPNKEENARRAWLSEVKTHINVHGRVKASDEEQVLGTWAKVYDTKQATAKHLLKYYWKLLQEIPYKVISAVEIVEWWESHLFDTLPEKFGWKEDTLSTERTNRMFSICTDEIRARKEKKPNDVNLAERETKLNAILKVLEERAKKDKQKEDLQINAGKYNRVTEELAQKIKGLKESEEELSEEDTLETLEDL